MQTITTKFSEKELTDLGRAMERTGHADLNSFVHWAISKLTAEVLAPSPSEK